MVDAAHPNCQAVQRALDAAGAPGRIRILAEPAPTAERAAAQLGVETGAIANSLIFVTDAGEPVLIMASGAHRVDLAAAAAVLSVPALRRADPVQVRAATGQPIGGVAPVGHPQPLRTLVDRELARHNTVWAAGGVPHAVFPTTFDELVRLTTGTPAEVA